MPPSQPLPVTRHASSDASSAARTRAVSGRHQSSTSGTAPERRSPRRGGSAPPTSRRPLPGSWRPPPAPKPAVSGASCTTTTRPGTFGCTFTSVSMSSGARLRRSTTPTSRAARFADRVGGLDRGRNHRAPGDHDCVGWFAHDARAAELDEVLSLGDVVLRSAIQRYGLEEEHRIGIAHRAREQPLGVGRGGWHDDLQARRVRVGRFDRVGVVLWSADTAAVGSAHGDRTMEAAPTPIAHARELPDDLVVRLRAEARELDLGHGHEPCYGQPDARADDGRFRDRRVEDPRIAESLEQPVGDPEHSTVVADVLAEQDDPFVAGHLGGQRVVDGREHRHGRQEMSRPSPLSRSDPPRACRQFGALTCQPRTVVGGDVIERVVRVDRMFERGVDDPLEPGFDLVDERLVRQRRPSRPASPRRARNCSIGSRSFQAASSAGGT